jgi:hypothetical protein
VFVLFVMIEASFLADLYTLFIRHSQAEFWVPAIGLQLNLVVSVTCFWSLWRKKCVVQVGRVKQNFFTVYLSLAILTLLSSLLFFREIGLDVYKVKHLIAQ